MGKQVIYTDRVMRPIAHFSHAARIGNVVHLGATAGTDAARRLAGDAPGLVDTAAQTRQMFDNAALVLELLGARLDNVVRVKTYIADLRDRPVYEAAYAKAFGSIQPNHVVVGSAGFPLPQAAIELDLVAVVDTPIRRFGEMSGSVAAGGRVYCSAGPAPVLAAPPLGFDAQCQAAMARLRDNLASGGCGFADVVYLHATVADSRDLPAFAAAFALAFPGPAPAAAAVVAPLCEPGWRLQLEAIAVPGGGQAIVPAAGIAATVLGSPAVMADDDLYIGGQLGIDGSGSLATGVEAQTRAAWGSVRAILAAAGLAPDSILRTNNVLTDWRNYAGFNAGYGANVAEPYPPRATVLGGLWHPNALVQVEGIAHRAGADATIVQVR